LDPPHRYPHLAAKPYRCIAPAQYLLSQPLTEPGVGCLRRPTGVLQLTLSRELVAVEIRVKHALAVGRWLCPCGTAVVATQLMSSCPRSGAQPDATTSCQPRRRGKIIAWGPTVVLPGVHVGAPRPVAPDSSSRHRRLKRPQTWRVRCGAVRDYPELARATVLELPAITADRGCTTFSLLDAGRSGTKEGPTRHDVRALPINPRVVARC
jgi:hypothetical protein